MNVLAIENLSVMAGAPGGISALRRMILDLALSGRLTANADGSRSGGDELPTGWQATTVGSIAECLDRLRRPITKQDRRAGSIPYYGASGIVDYIADYIFDEPLVLVGEDGAKWGAGEATAFRIEGRAWVNNHAHVLRPNRELVLDRFLELSLVAEDLSPFITGMTVPKLNQARLNLIPIALPPISEQHRIVAKVDELMALCDRLDSEQADAEAVHAKLVEALLASLTQARDAADFRASWQQLAEHFHTLFTTDASVDALKQTVLQLGVMGRLVSQNKAEEPATLLLARLPSYLKAGKAADAEVTESGMGSALSSLPAGWCSATFGEICQIKSELVRPEDFLESNQVAPDCIEKGTGRLLERRTVRQAGIRGPNNRFVAGQILYSKIRPSLSKAVLVDFDGLCSADMYPINSYIDPRFQLSMMLSEMFLAQVRLAENRVKMPKLNQESLNSFVVPVPPLDEQRRIVAKVDEILALCDQLKLNVAQTRQHHEHLASVLVEQAVA